MQHHQKLFFLVFYCYIWNSKAQTCNDEEFQCPGTHVCIPSSYVCDYIVDCPGGEDETEPACPGCHHFQCGDGSCIPDRWMCDLEEDCFDGSDELNCPSPGPCDEFLCGDGKCIPERWVCNDWIDCDTDEINCPCKGFECLSDGKCIPSSRVCDKSVDCGDWSDEANCTCEENEIFCGVCINPKWVCDFVEDCPDGSDEGEHCDYNITSNSQVKRPALNLIQFENQANILPLNFRGKTRKSGTMRNCCGNKLWE